MRILIIDDTPDLLKILEDLTESLKYETSKATNGIEALKLIKETSFDVIVSDYSMPLLNGIGLRNKIEELPIDCPPFILFTSYNFNEEETPSDKYHAIINKDFLKLEDCLLQLERSLTLKTG